MRKILVFILIIVILASVCVFNPFIVKTIIAFPVFHINYWNSVYLRAGYYWYGTGDFYYIDKTGKRIEIAKVPHLWVGEFHQGLAGISIENANNKQLFGFMNREGTVVIEPHFNEVGHFSESRAKVLISPQKEWENQRVGYIDTTGNMVIAAQYTNGRDFCDGLAAVAVGKKYPGYYDDSQYGYIDSTGAMVIKPQFDYGFDFKNGYAKVIKNEETFYINKQGVVCGTEEIAVKNDYYWKQGGKPAAIPDTLAIRSLYALFDSAGNQKTEYKFYYEADFYEGLAAVDCQEGMGYINKAGDFVIGPEKDWFKISDFSEGLAVVYKQSSFFMKHKHDRFMNIIIEEKMNWN